jgi:twitching motility protein PilU
MNRVINFYPIENRPSLLLDLGATLQAVVSQRLVRTKTGRRAAAVEVLLNTRHVQELIQKGEINEIKEALEKSMAPGSQTFEQALFRLFMEGTITQDEALSNADSATNMLWLINQATAGADTSGDVSSDFGGDQDLDRPSEPAKAAAANDKGAPAEDPFSRTGDITQFRDIKIDLE